MGGCVSQVMFSGTQSWPSGDHPTAKIVSVNGVLREYPALSYVSQVIQAENSFSSSSSSSSSVFICSSDKLGYDDYIPALDAEDQLQADQIYFVLPSSKLRQRLTASDMASLAVKAAVALQKYASKNSGLRRKNKARISPVTVAYQSVSFESTKINRFGYEKRFESQKNNRRPAVDAKPSSGLSQDWSSARKLQRSRSRRTSKTAVRSFRLRLSTIYEGTTAL